VCCPTNQVGHLPGWPTWKPLGGANAAADSSMTELMQMNIAECFQKHIVLLTLHSRQPNGLMI
jgi:hypothetical protein